jgi:hypothetical protein
MKLLPILVGIMWSIFSFVCQNTTHQIFYFFFNKMVFFHFWTFTSFMAIIINLTLISTQIVWGHLVFRIVHSFVLLASLFECNFTIVVGPIAKLLYLVWWLIMMYSWSYYSAILINDFCRSYGTLLFSWIFNIIIRGDRNSSEVTIQPTNHTWKL